MRVAIFSGGQFSKVKIRPYDIIICADKGYEYAKTLNLLPNYVLGDFDSLGYTPSSAEKFNVEKDFSDTELCIKKAIELKATQIDIYFALGGRIDHELFNVSLLSAIKKHKINAKIIDENMEMEVINSSDIGRKYKAVIGNNVSIVPISKTAHIIKSEGLKYDAKGIVKSCETKTLSNVATSSEILVDVKNGEVILIRFIED